MIHKMAIASLYGPENGYNFPYPCLLSVKVPEATIMFKIILKTKTYVKSDDKIRCV